jgi:hypothetical protein
LSSRRKNIASAAAFSSDDIPTEGSSRFFLKPSSHPTLTTHLQLSEAEQFTTCVTADYVRHSASIEDVSDLIADLDQAL